AVSLGALRVIESFGLSPDAAGGHSYGELTALCAAGAIDEADLHRLSRLRGRLMADGGGDKGGMLAVSAPLETLEKILAEEGIDLVIANRNAPSQSVLSGKSSEIDRAATILASRNLSCKKLPVSAAFHSPLVADAAVPFLDALSAIEIKQGNIPVYANSTASVYPADAGLVRETLAGQLAAPVEFVAEIEAMYQAGIREFVEIGPGARLTGLVKAILGEREHLAVALDGSGGKRCGIFDLARLLAQLAAAGHELQIDKWDEDFRPVAAGKKPAMTVPLSGANYVQQRAKRAPSAPVRMEARGTSEPASVNRAMNISQNLPASRDAVAESLR